MKTKTRKVFTLTQKRTAIKDMRSLVAKGNSVSKARILVARTLDVSPNTIYYWEKKLYGDITRKVGTMTVTRTNHIAKPHITGVNLHVPGKGNITLDHELLTNISRLAGFTS